MDPDHLSVVLGAYAEAMARSSRLSRLRAHVAESFPDVPKLASAASVVNLTATSLSRFFHRQLGITYSEWMRLLRLSRAIELLRDTDLSIELVALRSGFGSVRAFRRVCSAELGSPPPDIALDSPR
jgi:transcriptional regulator GlxA family with amidase domain